jgi:hypothetical protein
MKISGSDQSVHSGGFATYDRCTAAKQAKRAMISGKSATCFNLAHFKHAFTNSCHGCPQEHDPLPLSEPGATAGVCRKVVAGGRKRSQREHATQDSHRRR